MTDPTTPTSPVTQTEPAAETAAEVPSGPPLDLDVLVVGAGIAGVDVACRLQQHCPDAVWAVLEARERAGVGAGRVEQGGVLAERHHAGASPIASNARMASRIVAGIRDGRPP